MSPLKPGVTGGFVIRCVNPECGALYESEQLECPPGWTELADGYACPRERLVITWLPKSPEEVVDEAAAIDAAVTRQRDAERAHAEREAQEEVRAQELEAKRAERDRRLIDQEAEEGALREQLGQGEDARNLAAERGAQIRKRLERKRAPEERTAAVSRKAVTAAVEERYAALPQQERDEIVRVAMRGEP